MNTRPRPYLYNIYNCTENNVPDDLGLARGGLARDKEFHQKVHANELIHFRIFAGYRITNNNKRALCYMYKPNGNSTVTVDFRLVKRQILIK